MRAVPPFMFSFIIDEIMMACGGLLLRADEIFP